MKGRWLSCGAGVVILAGVMAEREFLHASPADATAYLSRAQLAANGMPRMLGDWVGTDADENDPMQQAAVRMLRPNVLISRTYRNIRTGQSIGFLLVQCQDARDMIGHYPRNCYPTHGWTMESAAAMTVKLDDLAIDGTSYRFSQSSFRETKSMNIFNFMILPNGATSPNLDGVYLMARKRALRYFGAGQIQVITDVGMPDNERQDILNLILGSARPAIDAIRNGVTP